MEYPLWLLVVIIVGSAARVTRLITRDSITQTLRARVLLDRDQRAASKTDDPLPAPTRPRLAMTRAKIHQFLICDWCVGFWVSIPAALAAYAWHDHPAYVAIAGILTIAYIVGWLAGNE